jgi:hypothetical protein
LQKHHSLSCYHQLFSNSDRKENEEEIFSVMFSWRRRRNEGKTENSKTFHSKQFQYNVANVILEHQHQQVALLSVLEI